MSEGGFVPLRVADIRFAAIDFESAGAVRGATDVPVQIGVAVTNDRGEIDISRSFVSFLSCDRPVHWTARKVHGITDEDIAGAPSLYDVWPEIRERLRGSWIVAHGSGTEKRFLKAFPGHGFGPWIDTLQLYRQVMPGAASHSLSYLCREAGVEDDCFRLLAKFRWHDALSDAVASLVLLKHWIRAAGVEDHSLDHLRNLLGLTD